MAASTLTILFEDPFWIGLYERQESGHYEVSKITFGAEPKDHEVYEFMLKNWHNLRFSPALEFGLSADKRLNPKRQSRQIHKQAQISGIGTKAQQALKLQQEQGKQARKTISRAQRDAEKDRQFALKQQKRREKHQGH